MCLLFSDGASNWVGSHLQLRLFFCLNMVHCEHAVADFVYRMWYFVLFLPLLVQVLMNGAQAPDHCC